MTEPTRRAFLGALSRTTAACAIGGVLGMLLWRRGSAENLSASRNDLPVSSAASNMLWQIDPAKCMQCGKCATACVLTPSAVKCFHAFALCGYCDLCTGFFEAQPNALNTGAENQLCPTAAIRRSFVEEPYFEYTIDHALCIGCGKCVKGCNTYGNGSLYLQIDQGVCAGCNRCSIAAVCPGNAITRVSRSDPYRRTTVRGT